MDARRSAVGFALVFAAIVAAGVLVASVTIGGAAIPEASLTQDIVPKPVTAGQSVLDILKFSYGADASPTTLTHAYVDVTIDPPLSESTDLRASSSDFCDLRPQSLSVVRCDLGTVRAGDTRTMFVVVLAPSGSSITMNGTAYWNENVNGGNPDPNNSVVGTPMPNSTTVVASTFANANGKCTSAASTLDTSSAFGAGNQQATHVDYPANAQGLPCTPAVTQDDLEVSGVTCGSRACKFSRIILPNLTPPGEPEVFATDTITFNGSLFPSPGPGPNPNTFRVVELLDPPDVTTETVPLCSSGDRTDGGACEVSAAKFGSRGIQVVLSVRGSLIDPSYGG